MDSTRSGDFATADFVIINRKQVIEQFAVCGLPSVAAYISDFDCRGCQYEPINNSVSVPNQMSEDAGICSNSEFFFTLRDVPGHLDQLEPSKHPGKTLPNA